MVLIRESTLSWLAFWRSNRVAMLRCGLGVTLGLLILMTLPAHAAMVVADTATELALGQARQLRQGAPPAAGPVSTEIVVDAGDLLSPRVEEDLTRELSRVWIDRKLEVFIRTVRRQDIVAQEQAGLDLVRGRSGDVLVLFFTESPDTHLFVLNDRLASRLEIDGVRTVIQTAFGKANDVRAPDARIIATVVALLQEVIKQAGPAPAVSAAPAAPAVGPTPADVEAVPGSPEPSGAAAPQSATSDVGAQAPSVPTPESPRETPPASGIRPMDTVLPHAATPEPDETLAKGNPTQETALGGAPPANLLLGALLAVGALLAFFAWQKFRPRKSRLPDLSINAPSRGLNPKNIPRGAEPAPEMSSDTIPSVPGGESSGRTGPVAASGPAFKPASGLPQRKKPVQPERARMPTIRIRTDPKTGNPIPGGEAPLPNANVNLTWDSGGDLFSEEGTAAQNVAQADPSPLSAPPSVIGAGEELSAAGSAVAEDETLPGVPPPLMPPRPLRTPLLRKMGMEPDQLDLPVDENAPPERDDLFQRIDGYVAAMRQASDNQRVQMLSGLEILLMAYRERVQGAEERRRRVAGGP